MSTLAFPVQYLPSPLFDVAAGTKVPSGEVWVDQLNSVSGQSAGQSLTHIVT